MIDIQKERERIENTKKEFIEAIDKIGQRKVAAMLGVGESYLSHIKAGRKPVSYEKLLDFFEKLYLEMGKEAVSKEIKK